MSITARTLEEVIARLADLDSSDPETAHAEADMLLTDALLILYKPGIVNAYLAAKERCGFWYA